MGKIYLSIAGLCFLSLTLQAVAQEEKSMPTHQTVTPETQTPETTTTVKPDQKTIEKDAETISKTEKEQTQEQPQNNGTSFTGKALMEDCKIAIATVEQNKQSISVEEMGKAMFCAGFIYGLASGESIASQYLYQQVKNQKTEFDPNKHSISFCMPFETSNEKNIRDIIKFIETNPKYQNMPASFAVWDALSQTYPCK